MFGILQIEANGTLVLLSTGQVFRVSFPYRLRVRNWKPGQHVFLHRVQAVQYQLRNFETGDLVNGELN